MSIFNKVLLLIYLIILVGVLYYMITTPLSPVIVESQGIPLEFSNFTSDIILTKTTDQYGNLLSNSYDYNVYSDLNDNYSQDNQTVHIKAYDSNWNYLENISKNVSLSSLDSNSESSNRNFDYNYYFDELVDYKYVVFEIYDNNTKLCYNKTVEFDLNDVEHRSKIEYYGGLVW